MSKTSIPVITVEPSYQNKSCSQCQQDVRNHYPRKDRNAIIARKAKKARKPECTAARKARKPVLAAARKLGQLGSQCRQQLGCQCGQQLGSQSGQQLGKLGK